MLLSLCYTSSCMCSEFFFTALLWLFSKKYCGFGLEEISLWFDCTERRNEKLTQEENAPPCLQRKKKKIWRARCDALCQQLLLLIRKRRHADERGRGRRSRKPVACRTLALNKCNKKRVDAALLQDRSILWPVFFYSVLTPQLHTEKSFLGGMHWYLCSDIRGPQRMDPNVSDGPLTSPVRFLSHGSRTMCPNIVRFEWNDLTTKPTSWN